MGFQIAALLLLFSLALLTPGASAQSDRKKSFTDQEHGQVKITNGPIVESLKSDAAVIAWSTNLKSDSKVAYGEKRNRLDQLAEAPADGKGLMHRLELKDLEPSTTYYFRIRSQSEVTAANDSSTVLSCTTPALGAEARHNELPR